MWRWLWVSGLVVILDQITKATALAWLAPHTTVPVMPMLNLTLTFNRGAAFGFLHGAPGWQNALFILIALVAAGIILNMLRGLSRAEVWLAVALTLVLGGAIGNMIDRLVQGQVVDFIDVYFGSWHFWTFNVADSAISIGAVILVADALFRRRAP